ncbi:hypothetical protein RHSIM_Rhsim08G0010600 [Rhododendron simsii]|uniref:Phototropic-responsive NPH3 family protein n=1 Tax=Rhododendron simsii TaxID=118357 RepID=A0A834GGE3_RHOSS|nr:hypothetical protein RHSIM_Rhsim08G0010600 [Rhododendron simsii]
MNLTPRHGYLKSVPPRESLCSSLPMAQLQSPGSDSDGTYQVHNQSVVVPANLIFEKKEHSWFASSQIPTDLSIQVQDITFHVHKFPLVSRCGYLSQVNLQPTKSNPEYDLKFEKFPGGSETFETIVKFCYGLPISLNPNNVAALRCASELLEMTEALEDGNLISKTDAFLTFVVLSSWRDSLTVLKTCESLSPWAENLQIVRRCCDSIAWKVSQVNPTTSGMTSTEDSWWFQDTSTLRIDHFVRIITASRAKGLKQEIVGSCIMYYAGKWLPGMDAEMERLRRYSYSKTEMQLEILSGRTQEAQVVHNKEQRMIVENLVSILPPQKETVSCKFLLGMLKMALFYSASSALVSELEKRIGMVLEKAEVNDLLVPSCTIGDQGKALSSPDECTMHNIDVVQRILEYFLMHEQQQQQKSGKLISKILDSYLAEVARDPNLQITKFQVLAETLPENARTCHDGIYRAIDTYLKSVTSQVLLSEQVKMREAMQGKEKTASRDHSDQEESWSSKKEITILKEENEKVKAELQELRRDYAELHNEYEKRTNKQKNFSGWTFGWKKIRNSSFFNKTDGDETRGEQQRSKSSHQRVSLRRRLSLS